MRFLLSLALTAALVLTVSCANDDDTAALVVDTVNPKPKFSLTPTVGLFARTSTTSKPTNGSGGVDLTPTLLDTKVDCKTNDGSSGVCVLYYQCDINTTTVITDGTGLINTRTNACPHYLQVCCKERSILNEKEYQVPNEDTDSGMDESANRNRDSGTPATEYQASQVVTSVKTVVQCGFSNIGGHSLRDTDAIMKTSEAQHGEFRWMIAVIKKSNSLVWSQADYLGGGTLIHPSVVMTAAHKLQPKKTTYYKANELKCRAGEHDTQTESEIDRHQERDVAKFIVHEEYYRTSLFNDIALLFLEQPFLLDNAPHIGIACLGVSAAPTDRVCYSMGWGRNDPNDKKKNANVLKKVLLNIVQPDTCQELLRNTRLGPYFELDPSLMCASGTKDVDSCKGDGGSSLVCAASTRPGERQFVVYGMAAYGIECFKPSVPGVYVNTVFLKSWIDAKIQQEGFSTSTYTI